MRHADRISEAMEVFQGKLPDPNRCNKSTIISEQDIMGKTVKFRAQKAKGLSGITWRVDYVDERHK